MPATITVYTFAELTPAAQERALERLPAAECAYTLEECVSSLKALCKLTGVTLADWSLGPHNRSFVRVEFGEAGFEIEDISGPRALAWIENNILGPLRQPQALKHKGRKYTRPGAVPACPLTGVCYDEDLLDAFRDRDMGATLRERFESLAGIIQNICETDLEYQDGAGRMERAEAHFDGALFDKHGHISEH